MEKVRSDSQGAAPEEDLGAEGEPVSSGESMESLLAQQDTVTKKLADKQVTWVKVIQVTKENVLVDVGEKNEGMIPVADWADEGPSEEGEPSRLPSPGQRIPVVKVGQARGGGTMLSYKRAKAHLGWDTAVKAFGEKVRVRGMVRSAIKGGFLVDVGGVSGFLPASLADLRPVRDPAKMVGTGVRCYIIELNEAKKQVVLSRKAVLQEEASKRKDKILQELKVGAIRIGRVVHSGPTGLIVDIGGAEGVVKPADVAWGKVTEMPHKRGDKVRAKVLALPAAPEERVVLGLKQLLANPADGLKKKYPPKTVVQGEILEAGPNGVRFKLDGKQLCYCPAAEMDPDVVYKVGEKVSAIVSGVHVETFELMVSIRKFDDIRDRKRMAQYLKAPKPLTLGDVLSPENREG